MSTGRREFLVLGTAPLLAILPRQGGAFEAVRTAIRRGDLGKVVFCRIFATDSATAKRLLESARRALDEQATRPVLWEGRFATMRCPHCTVSVESGAGRNAVTFIGERDSLGVEMGEETA